MASVAIPIFESLTSYISSGTYSIGVVTAERTWAVKQTREEVQDLNVLVVGEPRTNVVATRGANEVTVNPFVVVEKAINPSDVPEVDILIELVEELEERIERVDQVNGVWVSQDPAELSTEYLHQLRLFLCAFQVSYKLFE